MPLNAGTRLGPYEILAPLGAGGMGEVYRARDTRLDRVVAIKVLPADFATDASARVRLDREARVISQLNHPQICTLHDIGQAEGHDFLVLEYLEGETLFDRLGKGALPIAQVLTFAIQIADALGKAHRAGITHRDLKPANVMLTKSGAKLLDFGLAKKAAPAASLGATALATREAPLTEHGTILGTFQYMAPEQLEGQEADARTDIFAFGALLYEMATGKRAFEGKTRTSLIAAIVGSAPPPLSKVQPLSPPALEHVVEKCLAKDPDDRWQSAHDIAEELRWISQAGSQAGVAAPLSIRRKTRETLAWAVAAIAVIGLAATGFLLTRGTAETHAYSLIVPRADSGYMFSGAAQVSPDGKQLCFMAATGENKPPQIFVRTVDSFAVRALDGTENANYCQWGLDNHSIVFSVAGKSLKIVDVLGGPTRAIFEGDDVGFGGYAMNRDGVVLIGSALGGIRRTSSKGGALQTITTPDKSRHEEWQSFPVFLPDGKHFLFISFLRDPAMRDQPHYLYAGALDSKDIRFLGEIPSQVQYVDPGYLLFVRDGTLLAARFDAAALEMRGDPQPIADGVLYFKPTGGAEVSASTNGVVTYRAPFGGQSLAWVDRSGRRSGTVGPVGDFGGFRFLPGGSEIVAEVSDLKIGTPDIWLFGLKRDTATRVTFAPGYESNPVLTPDGRTLFYASDALGVPDIFMKRMGSAEDDRPFIVEPGEQYPMDVSPDGKFLVYVTSDFKSGTQGDLYVIALDGRSKATPFVRTPFDERDARFSPDGKTLAYYSNESGEGQVYVKPFPGPGPARQISTKGGGTPRWSPDGRQLYFNRTKQLYVVDANSPEAEPRLLFDSDRRFYNFEVAPDGQRFLMNMIDEAATQTPTRVIVNWPELLKKADKR